MARIPWDLVLIGGFGYVAWKKGWIDQLLAGPTTSPDPTRERGTGSGSLTVKPPGPALPTPGGGTPGPGGTGSGTIIVRPPGPASSAAGATERSIGAGDGSQFGLLRVTR